MTVERGEFKVLAFDSAAPRTRDYKRRAAHKKSRSGCQTCKAKKVRVCTSLSPVASSNVRQCDESRPRCSRCRRNCWQCTYEQLNNSSQASPADASVGMFTKLDGSSTLNATAMSPLPALYSTDGTSSRYLLKHLHIHWAEIFDMPGAKDLVKLSQTHPLVRSTAIAIAACHLRHLSPFAIQHRIAEHFQQSLVLKEYQIALETSREKLDQTKVNVLLLSGALMNVLAFALPQFETLEYDKDADTHSSWVFSTRADRLDWLELQVGLKSLMGSTMAFLDDALAFVSPLFIGNEGPNWTVGVRKSLNGAPQRWMEIFELEDDDDRHAEASTITSRPRNTFVCDNPKDVFRSPVTALIHLREVQPVHRNVFKNLQFLGKIQLHFRGLLYRRDTRALWLFGYWLGLMCRYKGVWWCEKRAKRDYEAIKVWLQHLQLAERPGRSGRLWKEMMEEYELAPQYICIDMEMQLL